MLKVRLCLKSHFYQLVLKWSLMLVLTFCQIMTLVIITTAQKQTKPPRSRVYVANSFSPSISVIDASTNAVFSTIPLDATPRGIVINPAGTRLFICQINGTVSAIDTATNTVSASIVLPTDNSLTAIPFAIAINPDGSRVYVTYSAASAEENWLGIIDTTANAVMARLKVGVSPLSVAVNPAGTLVFVAHQRGPLDDIGCECDLTVVDATNNTVLNRAALEVTQSSVGLIVGKDNKLYATDGLFRVHAIDLSTLTVVNKITVGGQPQGMVFDQSGAHLFVPSLDSNSLSIVEIFTGAVEAVQVGMEPVNVAIDSSGKFAYVVNKQSNTVSRSAHCPEEPALCTKWKILGWEQV